MISPQRCQAVQRVLLLIGLFLTLVYFLVLVPLCDRAAARDKPLEQTWSQIIRTRMVESDPKGINFAPLDQRLRELEILCRRLGALSNTLARRVSLEAPVLAKMRQPFQLVDFQNERQLNQEELLSLASSRKVALAPAVIAGYPEYSADLPNPELLWGHLAITHEALKLAVACQVSNITSVTVRPARPLRMEESGPVYAYELPASLQMIGTMPAISQFLASLPVRTNEVRQVGVPEVASSKPALFIDRLLLRKEAPDKNHLVRLEVRLSGLILADR